MTPSLFDQLDETPAPAGDLVASAELAEPTMHRCRCGCPLAAHGTHCSESCAREDAAGIASPEPGAPIPPMAAFDPITGISADGQRYRCAHTDHQNLDACPLYPATGAI